MPQPNDELLKLDVADIGTLNEVAFQTRLPDINVSHTVCFWFCTSAASTTKVIANFGNKTLDQPGWTVYLQGSKLYFRANFGHDYSIQLGTDFYTQEGWHHFTGTLDLRKNRLAAFLNGASENWHVCLAEELVEPGSVDRDMLLTVGGYTDAAGGHFDYRFGKNENEFVDSFRLYPRLLNNTEIKTFVTKSETPVEAKFVAWQDKQTRVVHFDASDSRGEALTYLWDLGDDSRVQGKTVEHTYLYSGTFRVTLYIFDEHHQQASVAEQSVFEGETDLPDKTAVFVNGADGYACFRIPAIVKAMNGDLLAFAEGRLQGCSDATQTVHIVSKRSKDQGQTWLPLQVVARNMINGSDYACMNPAPVVDTVHGTGRIIVVYNKMETSEWAITQGRGITRVFCSSSYDHGVSWTHEQDITLQVHKPSKSSHANTVLPVDKDADWRKQVPTLGHAIQLTGTAENSSTRGRLFFVGCRTKGDEPVFYTQNYAFWSDDLGQSWQLGDVISLRGDGSSAKGLGEATAVELVDGSIMVNSRNYQNGKAVGARAVTLGKFDLSGQLTFSKTRHDSSLVDSGVQASLIRHPDKIKGVFPLIFANPRHSKVRRKMTVLISYDEGKTWSKTKLVDPGVSAYSDLVILVNRDIGLLYEQGNQGGIVFTSLSAKLITT